MITTSLIPLENILPEELAFIIGFSCTVWTKMKSFLLAPWLMECHLNSSLPTNIRKVRGHQNVRGENKLEMLEWLNTSLKSTERSNELSTTLYLKSKINFFKYQDACLRQLLHPYLHHCLNNKQLQLKCFQW